MGFACYSAVGANIVKTATFTIHGSCNRDQVQDLLLSILKEELILPYRKGTMKMPFALFVAL